MKIRSYYYAFDSTGVDEIDRILSELAAAGKSYHHTDQWADEDDEGVSPVSLIQEAANLAADRIMGLRENT